MIVWSIQINTFYQADKKIGYIEGKEAGVFNEYLDKYHWMKTQMNKSIQTYNNVFPIWTWLKRPDLRKSGYMEKGTECILLEIEVDNNEILISGFEEWNTILNDGYIFYDEAEEEMVMKGIKKLKKEDSWERIFEYEKLRQNSYWSGADLLQGTMGRVYIDKIKSERIFIAK